MTRCISHQPWQTTCQNYTMLERKPTETKASSQGVGAWEHFQLFTAKRTEISEQNYELSWIETSQWILNPWNHLFSFFLQDRACKALAELNRLLFIYLFTLLNEMWISSSGFYWFLSSQTMICRVSLSFQEERKESCNINSTSFQQDTWKEITLHWLLKKGMVYTLEYKKYRFAPWSTIACYKAEKSGLSLIYSALVACIDGSLECQSLHQPTPGSYVFHTLSPSPWTGTWSVFLSWKINLWTGTGKRVSTEGHKP